MNLANPGAMPASNVQLTLFLSEGLEATTRAQGPMPYQIAGKRIFFQPITRMPENGKYLFHVGVRGIGTGDQVVPCAGDLGSGSDADVAQVRWACAEGPGLSAAYLEIEAANAAASWDCKRSAVCYNLLLRRDTDENRGPRARRRSAEASTSTRLPE